VKSIGPALVFGLVTVGIALASYWSGNVVVDTVGGLALVMVLPGTAILQAVDPMHSAVPGLARLFWAVAGSLGTAALGGLALNLTAGLTKTTWTVYLTALTMLATAVWITRAMSPAGRQPPRISPAARSVWPLVAWVIPGGLLTGAIALSAMSAALSDQESFVQAWLIPQPQTAGAYAKHAEVGISNHENRRETFLVTVRLGSTVLLHQRVTLAQGATWSSTLYRSHVTRMTATVALTKAPSTLLATVYLAAPAP